MCNTNECLDSQVHANAECKVFAGKKELAENPLRLMKCILPLRMLLLNHYDRAKYDSVMELMDHNETFKNDAETWNAYQNEVVRVILDDLNLKEEYTSEDVNRCIGIVRTNGIQSRINGIFFRVVFPKISLLSHSCYSNARCMQRAQFKMEVLAQRRIDQDADIYISYIAMSMGTRQRRKLLKQNWCFDCLCVRCSSRDELGSNLSTLKCRSCKHGYLTSLRPLDYDCDLVCSECDNAVSVKEVEKLEELFIEKLESITKTLKGSDLLSKIQKLLSEMDEIFHPNHNLVMRCKSYLISNLGNIPGFFYHELSKEDLDRKRLLCEEFLDVFSKVDPGASDWRGSTLFEMAMTRVSLAHRNLDSGQMPATDFREEMSWLVGIFDESMSILEVEEEGTHAKNLYKRARSSRLEVRDIVRFAEFLG